MCREKGIVNVNVNAALKDKVEPRKYLTIVPMFVFPNVPPSYTSLPRYDEEGLKPTRQYFNSQPLSRNAPPPPPPLVAGAAAAAAAWLGSVAKDTCKLTPPLETFLDAYEY